MNTGKVINIDEAIEALIKEVVFKGPVVRNNHRVELMYGRIYVTDPNNNKISIRVDSVYFGQAREKLSEIVSAN